MRTITLEELEQQMALGKVVLLEALPAMHYDAAHLPGAKNLPLDDLDARAQLLVADKTSPIVTYCTGTTCPNSKIAAERLVALGYIDVRAYEGGKEEWVEAGLPLEGAGQAVR